MDKDVSNQTVFVLAILAILISIIGVATVFFETSDFNVTKEEPRTEDHSTGKIILDINNEPEATSQGKIILNISNKENE